MSMRAESFKQKPLHTKPAIYSPGEVENRPRNISASQPEGRIYRFKGGFRLYGWLLILTGAGGILSVFSGSEYNLAAILLGGVGYFGLGVLFLRWGK